MHCQLRSPKETLYTGEATMVVAHSPDGEFAVMDRHAHLLSALTASPLRIKDGQEEQVFAISGGVLQVTDSGVTILAQEAIPVHAIDLAIVRQRREELERAIASAEEKGMLQSELDFLVVQERLRGEA